MSEWYPGKIVNKILGTDREKRIEQAAENEWLVWKNRNEHILRSLPEDMRQELVEETRRSMISLAKRVGR